jgi:hypothetical protein
MSADVGEERMWTACLRRRAVAAFPPDQLLPDRQPAYVAFEPPRLCQRLSGLGPVSVRRVVVSG